MRGYINKSPMDLEAEAMKAYAAAGVDLPELKGDDTAAAEAQAKADAEAAEKAKADADAKAAEDAKAKDDSTLTTEPKEERKRSIYDDFKQKKEDLKTERELREQAERERDDFKAKLEAFSNAKGPEAKQEAQDEIDSFITSHKEWDKAAIADLVSLVRNGVKPSTDPAVLQKLEKFEAWQKENALLTEKQMFDEEYSHAVPKLKELLPTASEEEMQAVKKELDRISHTTEFADKPLDYIAWAHKDQLSALVSPKKRGIESKGRVDASEESYDFDPNADYSSMSMKERELWEAEYKKMSRSAGLHTDGQGRRILL